MPPLKVMTHRLRTSVLICNSGLEVEGQWRKSIEYIRQRVEREAKSRKIHAAKSMS